MICRVARRLTKRRKILLERKFPAKAKVTVGIGEHVMAETVIGQAQVSSGQRLVKIAQILGARGSDVPKYLLKKEGERIYKGEILASRKTLFGTKTCVSPNDGVFESIEGGIAMIKLLPVPVRMAAGAKGKVVQIKETSVIIEGEAAQVFGTLGIGFDREGAIRIVAKPDEFILPNLVDHTCRDKILVGGALVSRTTIEKAVTLGVSGIVAGGISYRDYLSLGENSDIGVTIIILEGFGIMPIGSDLWEILQKLENSYAFLSTKERALTIPLSFTDHVPEQKEIPAWKELALGDKVKVIGSFVTSKSVGKVIEIGKEEKLENGITVQKATVKFNQKIESLPSANLEILTE